MSARGCVFGRYTTPTIIIEHEMTNQVVTYLESNKLLTNDQSAYRAQHSTQTALHKVVDDWLYNITDGLHTTVARSIYANVLIPSIILYYVRKWTSMVFMKMTLTYSGNIICLIENKL